MKKALRCDCGFEARAEDERDLVAQVQRHAVEAHGMALSAEEALLLAFRAELGDAAWSRPVAGGRPDEASADTNDTEEQ